MPMRAARCRCCASRSGATNPHEAREALAALSQGRRDARLLRHRRLQPWRPDAGAARRLGHPRRRRQWRQARPAAPPLLRQSRCADARARACAASISATTRFVVISKSGNTPETLMQIVAAIEAVRAAGLGKPHPESVPRPHRAAQPGRDQRPARSLRGARRIPMLPHDPGIGGRFSGLHQCRPAAGARARPRCRGASGGRARRDRGALLTASDAADFAPAVGAAVAVRPRQGARRQGQRDAALCRPARALRRLVRAALGREPRQEGRGARRRSRRSARSTSTASCSSISTARRSMSITVMRAAPTRKRPAGRRRPRRAGRCRLSRRPHRRRTGRCAAAGDPRSLGGGRPAGAHNRPRARLTSGRSAR